MRGSENESFGTVRPHLSGSKVYTGDDVAPDKLIFFDKRILTDRYARAKMAQVQIQNAGRKPCPLRHQGTTNTRHSHINILEFSKGDLGLRWSSPFDRHAYFSP